MTWLFMIGRWLLASPAGRAIGLAGVALAAVAGAFLRGRAGGRETERTRQAAARMEAARKARQAENKVAGRSDAENRERLKRWSR